jgi:hypothetical protein
VQQCVRGITARQSIGDNIHAPRFVFNGKIKAQEFAYPMVLWNCGQSLVKDILEGLMIHADDKCPTPEIWAPMAHCL